MSRGRFLDCHGDGVEAEANPVEERNKAEKRLRAIVEAEGLAGQRLERARSAAGRALAAELALTLSNHAKRIHDAVCALHAVATESIELRDYCESQGYRVPAEAIPAFSLYACGSVETRDALAHWLTQNGA